MVVHRRGWIHAVLVRCSFHTPRLPIPSVRFRSISAALAFQIPGAYGGPHGRPSGPPRRMEKEWTAAASSAAVCAGAMLSGTPPDSGVSQSQGGKRGSYAGPKPGAVPDIPHRPIRTLIAFTWRDPAPHPAPVVGHRNQAGKGDAYTGQKPGDMLDIPSVRFGHARLRSSTHSGSAAPSPLPGPLRASILVLALKLGQCFLRVAIDRRFSLAQG